MSILAFILIALFLETNCFHNLGIPQFPLMANLIKSIIPVQPCYFHILVDNLTSENLPTTREIPVTIYYSMSNHQYYDYRARKKSKIRPQLHPLRVKSWRCEFVILYLNKILQKKSQKRTKKPKNKKKLNTFETLPSLGYTVEKQIDWFNQNFVEGMRRSSRTFFQSSEFNYFIVVSTEEGLSAKEEQLFYALPKLQYYPNVGAKISVLYLPQQDKGQLLTFCVHLFTPDLFHCRCSRTSQLLPINEQSYSPSTEGRHWAIESGNEISLYFFRVALAAINGSDSYSFKMNGAESVKYTVFYAGDEFLGRLDGSMDFHIVIRVTKAYEGYTYLSCYSRSGLSFKFYAEPFQWEVWSCLAVSLVTMILVTDTYARFWLKLQVLSSTFYFIGSFLEETSSIPSKLWASATFRVGIAAWILLSSILSNTYVSLVIQGLNAPPDPERVSNFSQLVTWNYSAALCRYGRAPYGIDYNTIRNLGLDHLVSDDYMRKDRPTPNLSQFPGWTTLSMKDGWKTNKYSPDYYTWGNSIWRLVEKAYYAPSYVDNNFFYSFLTSRIRYYPRGLHELEKKLGLRNVSVDRVNEAVEEEIVACGKSVWVDMESNIRSYHEYLQKQYPFLQLYTAREVAFARLVDWRFSSLRDALVQKFINHFKTFIESGMVTQVSAWYAPNKTRKLRPRSKRIKGRQFNSSDIWARVHPMGLGSSVQTLFFLMLAGLGMGCLLFVVEGRRLVMDCVVKLCRARLVRVATWILRCYDQYE